MICKMQSKYIRSATVSSQVCKTAYDNNVQSRIINAEVLRGMDRNAERNLAVIRRRLHRFLHARGRDFAGVPGSRFYVALQTGELSYRSWCLRKH